MKKKVTAALLAGICIGISFVATIKKTEQVLSNNIIRLHVRANSDSPEDQQLKLKVRDRILKESNVLLEEAKDQREVYNILGMNLDYLTDCARNEIEKRGYSYSVEVTLGKSEFPTKAYGDICLPAGTYEALVINIGSGKGHNWWCVVFPPMCFAEGTVSEEGGELLKENLNDSTYDMISQDKPKIKFKAYELWQKLTR